MSYDELYKIISEEFFASQKIDESKKKLFEREIEKVSRELLNTDLKAVLSLDEYSTLVLRKLYGIYSGKKQTFTKVANDFDVSIELIRQKAKKAKYFLYRRILNSINKRENCIECLSSIELSERYKELKDKSLSCFGLYSRSYNDLSRIGVYTLGDLLSRHPYELMNYSIGIDTINNIKEKISQMGLKFIDDLTEEEKYSLIRSCSLDKLLNSSAYWISGASKIKRLEGLRKNETLFLTIKDALDYINSSEKTIPVETICDINKMGFDVSGYVSLISFLSRIDIGKKSAYVINCGYSMDSYLEMGISSLNLQSRTIVTLHRNRIYTLGDLVKKDKASLANIKKLDQKELYEIERLVHGLGFCFKDEANVLRSYVDSIYTNLNSQEDHGRSKKLVTE